MTIALERIRIKNLTAVDVLSSSVNSFINKQILGIESTDEPTIAGHTPSILPLPLDMEDDTTETTATISVADSPRTVVRQTGLAARAGKATGDLLHDITDGRIAGIVKQSKCTIYILTATKFTPRNFSVIRGSTGYLSEDRRRMEDREDELVFDLFSLTSVAETSEEKYQILETFGSDIIYFFGRRPRIWAYQGNILNGPIFRMLEPQATRQKAIHTAKRDRAKNLVSLYTQAILGRGSNLSNQQIALLVQQLDLDPNAAAQEVITAANAIIVAENAAAIRQEQHRQTVGLDWKNQFQSIYESHYRGTRCVENRSRIYISYENTIVEGFLLNLQVSFAVPLPSLANVAFSMLITGISRIDGALGGDRIPSILEIASRNAEREQRAMSGEQIIRGLTKAARGIIEASTALNNRRTEEQAAQTNLFNRRDDLLRRQQQVDEVDERITELEEARDRRLLTQVEVQELSNARIEGTQLREGIEPLQEEVRQRQESLSALRAASDSAALSTEHITDLSEEQADNLFVQETELLEVRSRERAHRVEYRNSLERLERVRASRDSGFVGATEVAIAEAAALEARRLLEVDRIALSAQEQTVETARRSRIQRRAA